jgi:hypothetical protein
MTRLSILDHHGVPVVLVDYRGITDPQDSLDLVKASTERLVAEPLGSVRVLMSVEGAAIAPEMFGALREGIERGRPHVKALAIVGLTGFLKAAYPMVQKALGVEMPAFDTADQALDWLAAQP